MGELKDAGFGAGELKGAGFNLGELKGAGFHSVALFPFFPAGELNAAFPSVGR